jgi:hypothetical protein
MAHEVSWRAANLRRLQRHALLTPAPSRTDPAEIAAEEQAEPRASREVHESTSPDSGFRLASPDKAVAMIIMHYLYAYGPATPQQFGQWIGAPPSWAAERFELQQPEANQDQLQRADR